MRVLAISNYRSYHTVRPEAHIFMGLAKMGVEVFIATYGDSKINEEFREAGVHLIDFHPEKKFDKKEIAQIRSLIIDHKIDILHLFNSFAIINGIQAAKGLDVKVVLYRGFTGHIHWYDPSLYFKYFHPRVDQIQCNAQGIKDLFDRNTLFGKKKTTAINKGHDLAWYEGYEPYDIRKELGLKNDAFLAVNVANNRKMKGIPYLLESFKYIPKEYDIHLIIAGRDMDNEENLKIMEDTGSKDRIHLLGFRENVLNIELSCDTFVLSSLYGESITKSVIEAMALGIPPIITDIPGNKELAVDGVSGLVVPKKNAKALADAMIKLYQNPEMKKQMGKKAKEHIAGPLNTKTTVKKVYEMYQKLLSE